MVEDEDDVVVEVAEVAVEEDVGVVVAPLVVTVGDVEAAVGVAEGVGELVGELAAMNFRHVQ